MMELNYLISILGAIGLGSLITVIVKHFLSTSFEDRKFITLEKKEAYLGLLDSLQRAAVDPSDENSKLYAFWQTRISLVGSSEVIKYTKDIVDTNSPKKRELRNKAFHNLVSSMRKDLNINKEVVTFIGK